MPSFPVTLLLFYIKWGVEFLLCINQQIIREHVIFFSVVSTCHVFIHIIKVYLLVFQFPSFYNGFLLDITSSLIMFFVKIYPDK